MAEPQTLEWAAIVQAMQDGQPVTIENADIEIPVGSVLRHGTVAREVTLKQCRVRGRFVINQVIFGESVSFTETEFENGLDLKGCTIRGQLLLQRVSCKEYSDFEALSVEGPTFFNDSNFQAPANFSTSSFGRHVGFIRTTFEANALFISSEFAGNFIVHDTCRFLGVCDLTFASINGALSIINSRFAKLFKMTSMHINTQLLISKSQFDGVDSLGIKIGGGVTISNCIYEGPLNMLTAQIAGPFTVTNTHFMKGSMVNLERTKIDGQLRIANCSFDNDDEDGNCLKLDNVQIAGGCSLEGMVCLGGFSAWNARILPYFFVGSSRVTSKEQGYDSYFHGKFSVFDIRVDGPFRIYAVFIQKEADMTGMNISGNTHIALCKFPEGARLNRTHFGGIFGTDSVYEKLLEFQGCDFDQSVRLLFGCVLKGGLSLYTSQFEKEANFGGAVIKTKLDLRYCRFKHSLMFNLRIPDNAKNVDEIPFNGKERQTTIFLEGCTYGTLVFPHGRIDIESVQTFIRRIPPAETASFLYLEQWLRAIDRKDQADLVRYYRFDKLATLLPPRSLDWWINRFYRYTTKYGTEITRVVSAILLLALAAVSAKLLGAYLSGHKKEWLDTASIVLATIASAALTLVVNPLLRRIWPQ